MRILYVLILCVLGSVGAKAQPCTTNGQTPSTAFPVCGTTTFRQNNVPICESHDLIVPNCPPTAPYRDKNPYWYKFTCYTSGTLAFVITPNDLTDDYDWQLYDITNRDPNEVFTNQSLIVTGNWSGSSGTTGASASGVSFIQCASNPTANAPTFSTMPNLQQGHQYLLLVSHFTPTQSGYSLSFGGGSAVITDPTNPGFNKVETNCNGNLVRLSIKKKIKCTSIAADGSDFFITPAAGVVTSSLGINCSQGFDSDSLQLQFDRDLPAGTYTLHIKNGSDGNTLLDHCDKAIPLTEAITFTVPPKVPTPLDSIAPLRCAPQSLRLVFSKPILCSSIASDGSDFMVNGTYPVAISSANGNCAGTPAITSEIIITLSQSLQRAGTFTLSLRTGSDGNTIRNECGQETPIGSSINFNVFDTVNADFNYNITYDCELDIVQYSHPGTNGVNQWRWNLDDGQTSTLQNPSATYSVFDQKNVRLLVSNGFCSDTMNKVILLDNFLSAAFDVFEDNCPNEPVQFTSNASGKITEHHWSFGDGNTGNVANSTHIYVQPSGAITYTVVYTVTDSFGCSLSASKKIRVYASCILDVPNAFTPNSDGKNDFLYPLNAVKAENLEFSVYNRWGQLLFKTNNWKVGWNGRFKGQLQANGAYIWLLRYVDRDSKRQIFRKGTAVLIR